MQDFGFLPFFLLLFCAHFTTCRISTELLSAAQFVKKNAFTPVYCCYTRHNSKNLFSGVVICGTFYEKLYFSIPCCYGQHSFFCMPGTVVIGSTIPVCMIFASGVVKRSTFFCRAAFPHRYCNREHNSKNYFLWLLYLTLFKNPTQNCDRRIFAQKIFFCVVTAGTL